MVIFGHVHSKIGLKYRIVAIFGSNYGQNRGLLLYKGQHGDKIVDHGHVRPKKSPSEMEEMRMDLCVLTG